MAIDSKIYFGRPGALTALRSPRGLVEATRSRRTATFELGIGGTAVDQMIGGARTYGINYDTLFREDFAVLQAYLDGLEGPGPFALLDPGQRNMLPPNIAGATSATNSVTGVPPVGGFTVRAVDDDFNRAPVASGYGTTLTGQTWAVSGGSAGNYNVANGVATMAFDSVNVIRSAVVDTGHTDFDVTTDVSFDVSIPTGNPISQWVFGRYLNANNYYQFQLQVDTAGIVGMQFGKRVGGTLSPIGGFWVFPDAHVAGDKWRIHFQGIQSGGTCNLKASAWQIGVTGAPTAFQISATDSSLTTGTSIGVGGRIETGNTNPLPVTMTWYGITAESMAASASSSTAYTDAGPRVLGVNFSAAPTGGTVGVGPAWPSSTFSYGVPVVSGRPVCFSCWVRGGGSDPITTWTPKLIWRNASGTVVSTTTAGSGTVASSSGAWAQMYVQGTPPAGAVYADWLINYGSGAGGADDFEDGVSRWTPTSATFVSSSAQAHGGTKSGLLTVTGAPSQAYVRQVTGTAVTPGVSYTASVWLYSTAGYATVSCAIDWLDSSGAYLTTTAGAVSALGAAAWAQRTATGTAPAGAAFAIFGPTLGGSPPAGTAVYLDDAGFTGTGVTSVAYFRRFMFNEGTTPDTTWMPGTGVFPVRFISMPESWPLLSPELRNSPTVVLQEDVS